MNTDKIKRLHDKKYSIIGKLTPQEIINYFIDSENEALKYQFQGHFYPMWHYEIKDVLSKTLKGMEAEKMIDTYFHLARLNKFIKVKENNYSYLLKGVEKSLHLLGKGYHISTSKPSTIFLLFGVTSSNTSAKLYDTDYTEYLNAFNFFTKINSYTSYPSLRKKLKPELYLKDSLLLKRAQKMTSFFNDFDFNTAGALVLLLADTSISSKQVLLKYHTTDLDRNIVWLIGSFYKDFNTTEANAQLLKNLYNHYPSEWVDDYEYHY
ncbi:hypothetical protein [Tenacibaculum larymnensis]|uniref:Uncharacterized protein n=1 Tax=Tenacibaculum larymnensis TaxID=2878201 RepID=A0A9X4IMH2_9FLAO|nr:hypothetical protein [Tenacibaculum larymnensis]MDE1207668.1 hypothetical protein [Tenacibaculum larymnensis]